MTVFISRCMEDMTPLWFNHPWDAQKGNTIQRKDKATQHNLPKAVIFQRKKLPQVGLEPMTIRLLGIALTNWATSYRPNLSSIVYECIWSPWQLVHSFGGYYMYIYMPYCISGLWCFSWGALVALYCICDSSPASWATTAHGTSLKVTYNSAGS